jgi:triosephosphate isomerase
MKPCRGTAARAIIGVSLKMYFSHEQTLAWCREVADIVSAHPAVRSGAVEFFALPAFPSLPGAASILLPAGGGVGAQDIASQDNGPFTGEVGGPMIAEVGARYAEVGHAERRRLFGEDDDVVGRKLAAALRNGLTPVLCVGELSKGTVAEATARCVAELDSVLAAVPETIFPGRVIVAYEPQWAIGAPEPAGPDYVNSVVRNLDEYVRERCNADSRVIYGGSAGPGLIARLDPSVAGLFLGRFAHNPEAVRAILDECSQRIATPSTCGGVA